MALRGGYGAAQLLLGDMEDARVTVQCEIPRLDFELEVYTLRSVMVERNHGLEDLKPHFPERVAPYRLYDCLRTFDGTVDLEGGVGGLYLAVKVDAASKSGVYQGKVTVNGTKIPLSIEVFAAGVPEETLRIINGYIERPLHDFHGLEYGSEEFEHMSDRYYQMLRRMHQNMVYTRGVPFRETAENQFEFDFSGMEESMRQARKNGIKYFFGPSVGGRRSWKEPTILLGGEIPAMSLKGYCYLTQYLSQLRAVVEKGGWQDCFSMGIADEPNEANCTEFRALAGLVHKLWPEVRLMDAMSYGEVFGSIDVCIALNAEYEKHKAELELLRAQGMELWHYVCCVPRGDGAINRFMDYPLLATRYLFWGNYRYQMPGYLHWAANHYQPGQDPFEQNCPEHHNADSVCFLPAGDTHIIYPGTDGPWMSIRLEAQRESAEDYELLQLIAQQDKALADAICEMGFRTFMDVEYDPVEFRKIRRKLYQAASELS